jgi:hypothetical protein
VLDSGEVTDDLVRDMVEVLTSLCARPYWVPIGTQLGDQGAGLRAA